MNVKIIPQIKEIKLLGSNFKLNDFHLDESVFKKVEYASEIFLENGLLKGNNKIVYVEKEMADERYEITGKSDQITIYASTAKALMYALFTISELALINHGELEEFQLTDEPTLNYRALSDDVSRGIISNLDHFLKIIRTLARYKYNVYMPYIEDVFKFDAIENWGKYSQPLSKDEWRVIINYAKKYHLEVRPIINLLGHFDKLSCLEDFEKYSMKFPNGMSGMAMDPKLPEVRELIKVILDEIIGVFGEGKIHVGGDEPFALTKIYGEEEGSKLFIEHFNFVNEEVKKRGCEMIMYVDFFAPPWGDYSVPVENIKAMGNDIEFVYWDYDLRDSYPLIDQLYEQNVSLYMSPGAWGWRRLSCDMMKSYQNTKNLIEADKARSNGIIMSTWYDGGDALREISWPGIVVGAHFAWEPYSNYSFEDVYQAFHESFFGISNEEAMLLDKVYHHDYFLTKNRGFEFKYELYKDPMNPIEFADYDAMQVVYQELLDNSEKIRNLKVLRNHDAHRAIILSLDRILFTMKKITVLPKGRISTLESGRAYSEKALELVKELEAIKEFHKVEWFKNNRMAEWESTEFLYDQMIRQLQNAAGMYRLKMQYMFKFLMQGEQIKF